MGQRLFARCLGEPTLLDAAYQPIRLRVRKHVALVLFLVLEPRHRATRERLKRLLWPDGNSAQSLSQAIVEIRRGLGDALFEVTDHHLALRPTADVCTDLQVLGTGSADLMIRELSQSFWSHVLFDGFEFEDAEEWNTWLHLERARWREKLGRMAEEVVAAESRTSLRDRAESQRLAIWSAHMLGRRITPISTSAPPAPAWSDVDQRVIAAEHFLPNDSQTCVLEIAGADDLDALAVLIAAVRRRDPGVSVVAIDCHDDDSSLRSIAAALLQMKGSAAAPPSDVSRLRTAVEDASSCSEAQQEVLASCGAVLDAIREEYAPIFLLDGASRRLTETLLRMAPTSASLKCTWIVWLGVAHSAIEASSDTMCVTRFTIEPASLQQLIEATAMLEGHSTHSEAVSHAIHSARGSVALLEALLQFVPRKTERGVAVRPLDHDCGRVARRLAETCQLPLEIATVFAKARPEYRVTRRASPVVTRKRATAKTGQGLDARIGPMLLLQDPSDALLDLEGMVEAGDGLGPSLNAGLLCLRTMLGLSNDCVVADQIDQRCAQLALEGRSLAPAESLSFALLLSKSGTRELVSPGAVGMVSGGHREASVPDKIVYAMADVILSQQTRDYAKERGALEFLGSADLASVPFADAARFVVDFGGANQLFRNGRYAQAAAAATRVALPARAAGHEGAMRAALGLQLSCAFRSGHYRDVGVLSSLVGTRRLRATTKTMSPHSLFAMRAATAMDESRWSLSLADMIEEYCVYANSLRGRLIGAEYLEATGRRRRAGQLAEYAPNECGYASLSEQQGIWAKWLARCLPTADFEERIESMILSAHTIDAREQLITYRSIKARGIDVRRLEEAGFHRHSVSETALAWA